ncbi:hypothetical protein GA0115234_1147131 [Streptomyces sp. DvalAA-43]|jgi:hypothetical protein|nr:hypothetical protein GA0115234_1147131 [Streptomyces sp. DvalAA-43]
MNRMRNVFAVLGITAGLITAPGSGRGTLSSRKTGNAFRW